MLIFLYWLNCVKVKTGESLTTISDNSIITQEINVDSLTANSLFMKKIGELILENKEISDGETSIELDSSPTVEDYIANLSYSGGLSYLKVTIADSKKLKYTKDFKIFYKVVWGSSYKTATVRIPAGASEGSVEVSAFWGIDNAYFYLESGMSGGGRQCTFKQSAGSSIIKVKGSILPSTNGTYALGDSNARWHKAFFASPIDTLSDKKYKNTIELLDERYGVFFDELISVRYKLNDEPTGGMHTGFIAQDVKRALDKAGLESNDFAGCCMRSDIDGNELYSLSYSEFISICVNEIQKLKKRVLELESIKK